MSYILDALTKAAQQRERQVPVVQRLLSAAPARRAAWARVPGRLPAALALSVGLLAVALVWWLRSPPSPAPPEMTPAALSASAPRSPGVEPARPLKLEPLPKPEIPTAKPAPVEREGSASAPPITAKPPSPPSATRSPAAVLQPAPAPSSAASAPATPAVPPPAAATPAERAGLKLEALIYSDVPAQRMVFINGRRYTEGDMVDGRLRVEEIQEDGVALTDQGRRFTLRVAR